jgi:hypothetical protein
MRAAGDGCAQTFSAAEAPVLAAVADNDVELLCARFDLPVYDNFTRWPVTFECLVNGVRVGTFAVRPRAGAAPPRERVVRVAFTHPFAGAGQRGAPGPVRLVPGQPFTLEARAVGQVEQNFGDFRLGNGTASLVLNAPAARALSAGPSLPLAPSPPAPLPLTASAPPSAFRGGGSVDAATTLLVEHPPGCAAQRRVDPVRGGGYTCEWCAGSFHMCNGTYGSRSPARVWEAGMSPDLTFTLESPNARWCCAACEAATEAAAAASGPVAPREKPVPLKRAPLPTRVAASPPTTLQTSVEEVEEVGEKKEVVLQGWLMVRPGGCGGPPVAARTGGQLRCFGCGDDLVPSPFANKPNIRTLSSAWNAAFPPVNVNVSSLKRGDRVFVRATLEPATVVGFFSSAAVAAGPVRAQSGGGVLSRSLLTDMETDRVVCCLGGGDQDGGGLNDEDGWVTYHPSDLSPAAAVAGGEELRVVEGKPRSRREALLLYGDATAAREGWARAARVGAAVSGADFASCIHG